MMGEVVAWLKWHVSLIVCRAATHHLLGRAIPDEWYEWALREQMLQEFAGFDDDDEEEEEQWGGA